MPLPPFPLINGNRYDYSSVEILIQGVPYRGIKSIDYSDSLDPAKQYGTSARPLGRTRGKWDGDGSLEIFKEDAAIIRPVIAALGQGGYGEANLTIVVAYGEPTVGIITDTLIGVRIKKVSDSHAVGNDGITEKWDLDLMDLLRNGISILSAAQYVK